MDRPTVLENILNDLFHVFRYETCVNLRQVSSWMTERVTENYNRVDLTSSPERPVRF